MLMTDLVNASYLAPLRWLGKYRWVTYQPLGVHEGTHLSAMRLTPPKETPLMVRKFILWAERQVALVPNFEHRLMYLYGISKALASGPKLIRPTYEQCVALANCEANLAFADYEQPYPVVILHTRPPSY